MTGYVNMRKRRLTLSALVLLLLFATALFSSACEPGGWLVIDNQRNEEVRIQVTLVQVDGAPDVPDEPTDYGVVPAQTTKQLAGIVFVKPNWVYRIEAVDPSGKVVFSHDYNMADLEKIDWKITIPP